MNLKKLLGKCLAKWVVLKPKHLKNGLINFRHSNKEKNNKTENCFSIEAKKR